MIEQIPRQISVASLDRTRHLTTTIGAYSIHHLAPELFDGYRGTRQAGISQHRRRPCSTPSTSARRAARSFFPELSLPENFDETQLAGWTHRVATPRLRTLVSRGVTEALEQVTRRP